MTDDRLGEAHIVTVTPTIGSGTVVRWHHSLREAETVDPFVSASRERVVVRADVRSPSEMRELAEVIGKAVAVMEELAGPQRMERVKALETHRGRFGSREYTPVAPRREGNEAS